MSKIFNLIIIGLVAAAFFMLKDELDQVKTSIQTINRIDERLHSLENQLNDLNVSFEQEKEETEKFKAQATKTIFDIVKSMGVK